MIIEIRTKSYTPPPFDDKEILRYAGCRGESESTCNLINALKDELTCLEYKVCYATLPVSVSDSEVDFDGLIYTSYDLAKILCGCRYAVVFVATLGVEIDRLITKYSKLSPSRALILDAIGNERIEAVCEEFCKELEATYGRVTRRFSPGYSDLDISYQVDIFDLLSPEKRIGVCLTDTLLMTPTKSVSAIVGIR